MTKQPNFLIVVVDDLGFTDTSPFGGEIDTPNLQKLAESGLRFTDFHTASACSPTRSMLFSGTDNHIAGLGQMNEFSRNFPEQLGSVPGYEGYLNFRVAALPEILQDNGYYTFLSGKWHLGNTPEYWPSARGFEKTFGLIPGAGNHFKYFPKDEEGNYSHFLHPLFEENGKRVDPESLPEDYYSTNYFTDKALGFLSDSSRAGRPFFGAVTYTAPHWPFQAPEEVIAKYKGRYDAGPGALRQQRLAAATKLGIIPEGIKPHQVETQRKKSWEELSDEEKKIEARIMEIYAAMVDIVDRNIGRLVAKLESLGELDNTFILFMSDNGAEGMMMEALPLQSARIEDNIKKYYKNEYTNIGKKDSFVWYSDQWAQAATAPAAMYKMWASEGGIRCPLIVRYPPGQSGSAGDIRHEFVTVMDILPTVLDIAGVEKPNGKFRDREVVPVRGRSWWPYLTGRAETVYGEDTVYGWELFAQQAIRKGRHKALFIPKPLGPGKWQLFDLKADPGETHDLAEEEPELLKRLVEHWSEYEAEAGVVNLTDVFYNFYESVYTPKVVYK